MIDHLSKKKVKRIMLPDTLGILNHEQTFEFCSGYYQPLSGMCILIFMPIMIMIWQLPTYFRLGKGRQWTAFIPPLTDWVKGQGMSRFQA
jgi:hypothetical protein